MSPATTTATPTEAGVLLTAEQYAELPDDGRHTELVKGRVVEMTRPFSDHGFLLIAVASILRDYVRSRDLGRVVGGDAGVVTQRGPDTVRGPDVAFHSYARVPKGPRPKREYWPAPELVVEVLSPSNRPAELTAKIGEYFAAGVLAVCVLDPDLEIMAVYPQGELPRRYTADEAVALPEVFPDFRARVRDFLAD